MKIATSYFYQIRFFKPYMIPFSTAVWDPKWYHENKGNTHNFLDKNGVLNGLRIKDLAPGPQLNGLCKGPQQCSACDPHNCDFLRLYKQQIENIPTGILLKHLDKVTSMVKDKMGFKEEPIAVLMVYEPTDNICSERTILHEVLNAEGVGIEELKYPIAKYY